MIMHYSTSFVIPFVTALLGSIALSSASANVSYKVAFASTFCSGEDFNTDTLLPTVKQAISDVNDLLRSDVGQLYLCNEEIDSSSRMSSDTGNQEMFVNTSACYAAGEGVMIFPGCGIDADNAMNIEKLYPNMILMTYAFSGAQSQDLMQEFHFRMVPHVIHLAVGLSRFVSIFNWTRVVIITQIVPVFDEISQAVQDALTNHSSLKVSVMKVRLSAGKDTVFFAYRKGMIYPGYVWITYGWYNDRHWWRTENSYRTFDNCSNDEIAQVLSGSIAVSHYPPLQDNDKSLKVANLTEADYYHKLVYDTVMVYGTGLNEAKPGVSVADVLRYVNVTGLTGQISFNSGFRYIQSVQVLQYRMNEKILELKPVGSLTLIQPSSNFSLKFIENESFITLWPDGLVPHDGTPREVMNYSLVPLIAVCYTFATLSICFALVCLVFNIISRNRTLVRLTSPTLNYIIIVGAIVIYSSVYTYFYIPGATKDLMVIECSFRLWLTCLGFSLCYIPISLKMWRVYHICRKPKPSIKNLFMKDWHLVAILFVFVMLEVIILVVVTAIGNARFTVTTIRDKEYPGEFTDDNGYTFVHTVQYCQSDTEPYWLSVIYVYKFILQAIGVILAFSIRKVKIKGLNDSREVSAILYITTAAMVAIIICTILFSEYINVDGAIFGFGICISTTFVLLLTFIPKMYNLYKDPNGENVFTPPDSKLKGETVVTPGTT